MGDFPNPPAPPSPIGEGGRENSGEDNFLELGRQVVAAQPFSVLLGTHLEAFAPGQVTMALMLQPQHTQQDGRVHDGVISYLAANALIFAGGSALGMPVVVAEYKVNYVRPAQG